MCHYNLSGSVESHLHNGHVNTSESEDLHLLHHKPRDVVVLHLHIGCINTVNQLCVIITLVVLLSLTSTLVMSTQVNQVHVIITLEVLLSCTSTLVMSTQ